MSGAAVERAAPKQRVRVLDILRGVSVVSMVAYHALYDLVYMFGLDAPWYRGLPGYLWQQSICWVFILVSGASLHYGRHVARRGLVTLGCALALTVVTATAMPGMAIWFGVLHMLACCLLLAALALPVLKKIPPLAGFLVCAALFVFLRGVPQGFVGLLDKPLYHLPDALYSTGFLFPLGLPGSGFWSSDYFALIPWMFLFFAGHFGWGLVKAKVKAAPAGRNPIEWIGRHSLVIYMAHQPVIYGVLWGLQGLGVL